MTNIPFSSEDQYFRWRQQSGMGGNVMTPPDEPPAPAQASATVAAAPQAAAPAPVTAEMPQGINMPSDEEMGAAKAKEQSSRDSITALLPGMQANIKGQQDVTAQYGRTLRSRESMIDNATNSFPKDHIKFVMQQSPLFLGLAALAGSQFHTSALTGLAAMNGAIRGMVAGDRQAYDDEMAKYKQALNDMLAKFDLQDKEYQAQIKNFGLSDEGNKLALQFAAMKNGWDSSDANKLQTQHDAAQKLLYDADQKEKDREAQIRAASVRSQGIYGALSPEENAALAEGAAGGQIDPYRITGRNQKTLAQIALRAPGIDMNAMHSNSAMMGNATYMNKQYSIEMLPEIISNMVAAGKKVNFSDVQFAGKLEKWKNGQLNDPDFINYMAQRNDALLAIASVMRGVGMSDKTIEKEYEASPATMSPAAFDAWAQGQMTALAPRIRRAHEFTRGNTLEGASPPANMPAPAAPPAATAPSTSINFNDLP